MAYTIFMTISYQANTEEREQIFKLRYKVYIEELGKNHIDNDNLNKIIVDEYDEGGEYFFAKNEGLVYGSLRVILFKEDFLKKLCESYKLPTGFVNEIDIKSLAFVDRFVIEKEFRKGILGFKIMRELYIYSMNHGICQSFITSEKALLHNYYQFGYRVYDHFYTSSNEKRYLMVFFQRDFNYLLSINSPFTRCFNDISLSDEYNSIKVASKYFKTLDESEVD